jgi:glycosyltransferase involved in cell wall biosynthesis
VSASPKHLLHVFPTFAVGGSQMRFAQLVRLHGARYRHTVIALDGRTDMAGRLTGLPIDYHPLVFDKQKTWESWRLFAATLRAIRPDVLFTYNWGAIEWALINRRAQIAPHVHIEDGFGPEEANRQLKRRIWTRRLALSGKKTTVVLPSRNLERIAREVWLLPSGSVRYIPNGIDCARFEASAGSGTRKPVVVGTVAGLRREKNVARLIGAFADVPGDGELLLVGDGAERGALERLAKELNVAGRVRFAGQSDRPEDWYCQMDIFALSSDTEQMPLSVLEAMAAGLPVVATNVGDVAQMVSAENRNYVVPADHFTAALLRLAGDAPSWRALGVANQKKARENFDEKVMAARYDELIG